mmetsp:Transcript_38753/g.88777  ORF Transcript_38753/g.88777 Transcript_38753/m.88777 type:complete len:694 (+) Transcript_38753:1-2082(+)
MQKYQAKKQAQSRGRLQIAESLSNFRGFLRKRFGCVVRGWRSAIDVHGLMSISFIDLAKACKQMGWVGNVRALWRGLGGDGRDDSVRMAGTLEQLDPLAARELAQLKILLCSNFANCTRGFIDLHNMLKPEVAQAPHAEDAILMQDASTLSPRQRRQAAAQVQERQVGTQKLTAAEFAAGLKQIGWKHPVRSIYRMLDFKGEGFVTAASVHFLDVWEAPEWLSAEADLIARDEFIKALQSHFDNPVLAWRHILDRDESNHVSFPEFDEACTYINFQGNRLGAWQALDDDSSGYITLRELNPEADRELARFKFWAEKTFGSVANTFRALDESGDGQISFREFRQAAKKYHFHGDVLTLLTWFDLDGSKTLTIHELLFLEDWNVDHFRGTDFEATVARNAEIAHRARERTIAASMLADPTTRMQSTGDELLSDDDDMDNESHRPEVNPTVNLHMPHDAKQNRTFAEYRVLKRRKRGKANLFEVALVEAAREQSGLKIPEMLATKRKLWSMRRARAANFEEKAAFPIMVSPALFPSCPGRAEPVPVEDTGDDDSVVASRKQKMARHIFRDAASRFLTQTASGYAKERKKIIADKRAPWMSVGNNNAAKTAILRQPQPQEWALPVQAPLRSKVSAPSSAPRSRKEADGQSSSPRGDALQKLQAEYKRKRDAWKTQWDAAPRLSLSKWSNWPGVDQQA